MDIPAFPQGNEWMDAEGNMRLIHEGGMTLRDYFAAAALPAITLDTPLPADDARRAIAKGAYAMADAMIAERGNRND